MKILKKARRAQRCNLPAATVFDSAIARFDQQILRLTAQSPRKKGRNSPTGTSFLGELRKLTDNFNALREMAQALRAQEGLSRISELQASLGQAEGLISELRDLFFDMLPFASNSVMLEQELTPDLKLSTTINLALPALTIDSWDVELKNIRFITMGQSPLVVTAQAEAFVGINYTGTDGASYQQNNIVPLSFQQTLSGPVVPQAALEGCLSVKSQRLTLIKTREVPQINGVNVEMDFQRITSVFVPGNEGLVQKGLKQLDDLEALSVNWDMTWLELANEAKHRRRLVEKIAELSVAMGEQLRDNCPL